jgi:hypothetical protein
MQGLMACEKSKRSSKTRQGMTSARKGGLVSCSVDLPVVMHPPVVMQKPSMGTDWAENAENADEAQIVQLAYFL